MDWNKEALKSIEELPLPPVMAPFAKMDAEMRAKESNLDIVTVDIVKATINDYEKTIGKEATEMLKAIAKGENADLPEEFFEEVSGELYNIQLCPSKFGACTHEKREMIRQILTPIKTKLKELKTTDVIMSKSRHPLMSHHSFNISIIGCPNACFSPWFSDFGVICVYKPEVKNSGCIQCGACVKYCSEEAIVLEEETAVIDYEKCVMCGGCQKMCPEGVIYTARKGYKVIVGGSGSRHPRIAQTVSEFTDAAGVLNILERAINLFKDSSYTGKEVSFHKIIKKCGIGKLQPY